MTANEVTDKKTRGFSYYPGYPSRMIIIASAAMILILAVMLAGCISTTRPAADPPRDFSSITQVQQGEAQIPSHPRIICLTSDAAELLVAIGAGEDVVGVPESLQTHHPHLLPNLPNARSVGAAKTPDVETMLALHPDLIIISAAMAPSGTEKWEAAGIPTFALDCHRAEDLPGIARTLGNLTSRKEKSEQYAVYTENLLAEIKSRLDRNPPSPRPTVYMESYTDYFVYGKDTGADELLRLLHCANVGANQSLSSLKISAEWVIAENPGIIIKTTTLTNNRTLEGEYQRVVNRTGFSGLDAIRKNRTYVVNGDVFFSPHAAVGALHLAKTLYPDRFSDMDPDTITREYSRLFSEKVGNTPVIFP